jgi:hypothetical protein
MGTYVKKVQDIDNRLLQAEVEHIPVPTTQGTKYLPAQSTPMTSWWIYLIQLEIDQQVGGVVFKQKADAQHLPSLLSWSFLTRMVRTKMSG